MRILILGFILSGQLAFGQETWSVFSPEDKSFEVLVPGKMEYGTKHVLTDLGEIKTITYLYKEISENPDPVYIINYTDYPSGILESDSTELLELFFQTSLDGIFEKLGGDMVYYADISNLYLPQKIYKINYNNGLATVKGKMSVYRDRFFSVQVFSSFEKSGVPEIDVFLDSFKVLNP